ncbi:LysR family transcriptional regulator [Furfurilactobacillus milii]|uniref:LysR family transcriptional regulator n=1 Tax=Furfurilactobacillus milii TaxID=2888272 RepID=A0A6N9I1J9_9LACO|nr:LysR family transcriptional regulator [Furfurilactobacillus milii]MYV16657.1 LysR family transcriptional regulator [Furfurilactobacillus milii]
MFRQMECFVAVVENHSFTKAAEQLNMSQSALSQRIKELSETNHLNLIEREGRGFKVTEAGEFFYRHCRGILENVTQLVAETQEIERQQNASYTLRLGYLRKFGSQEFLQAVAHFSKEFPKVNVRIHSGSYQELFDLIRDDQIDLNFSDQRHALSNVYRNEFLTSASYMVVLAPTMFAKQSDVIDTTELIDTPCILVAGADEFESEQQYYREILGIRSEFRIAKSFGEAQMLATAGQGYVVVNSRTASSVDTSVNKVVKLIDHGRDLTQRYYAYWKATNSGFYIETFVELLKAQFQ